MTVDYKEEVIVTPKYTLYVNGYENKERLVSVLTNNGYIVGAKLEKDGYRIKGWRIDIYGNSNSEINVAKDIDTTRRDMFLKELEHKEDLYPLI
jgi:hypothetical protein